MLMADSISPARIPKGWRGYVAGYANGDFGPENPEGWQFSHPTYGWQGFGPHIRTIRIGVLPNSPEQARICSILDIERFDASPADALPFLMERRRLGHVDGGLYFSLDLAGQVLEAVNGYPFRAWVADWTGVPHELHIGGQLAWAVQYSNNGAEDVDFSLISREQFPI